MKNKTVAAYLLQIALAFSLFYSAWRAFVNPFDWIGFFPLWLTNMTVRFVSHEAVLMMFSIGEIALGVWLLTGKKVWIPALLCAGLLGGIVIFNWSQMDILFRDFSLMLSALALATLNRSRNS